MSFHPQSRRNFMAHGGAVLTATSAAMGLLGVCVSSRAQTRSEVSRILCSGPPGSIPDIMARRVAAQLGGGEGRSVIVDNRAGAAGQLAVGALKNGPTDGGTVLLVQGAVATVYPYLYPRLAYDPVGDLAPVSLAGEMTLALAVGPLVPDAVASLRDLLDWMHRSPKLANVGSPGTGTLPHLLEAMLFREASTPWQHVAYSGGPPAVVDLLGGQIAALVLPEGLFRQHRTAGRLRVLATSGAQRTAFMPDVPTLAEQGFADLVVREWFGFFMSGRVAPAAVEAGSKALRLALAQPELVAAFGESAMVAASSTPATLAARIAAEQRYWEPVIRAIGVRAE